MGEIKREMRDLEDDIKSGARKADGNESVGDKLANAGDRLRHGAENLGDDVHEGIDRTSRDAAYERGRLDESAGRSDLDDDTLRP